LKKFVLLLLALIPLVALIIWVVQRRTEDPRVPFARVRRETLVSTLSTNGKAEPFEWQTVCAEAAGPVERVPVQEGQTVAKGSVLAILSNPSKRADIDAAEARVAEARANLAIIEGGGKPAELTDIENSLARAKFEREDAQREYLSLKRLQEKQAATAVEVAAAASKMKQSELEIAALERRRGALVSKSDRGVAAARLRDAEAALSLAQRKESQALLRAPIAGTVYQLSARPGGYLAVGDPVASVGRLDRLRVRVYVDEPELGRVAVRQPVTITWDALPGKEWTGFVEKRPSSIQTLGTRQVGEVICTIENPGRELIPGTNVNASIRTAVVEAALVVPKEVLRRDTQGSFVYVLRGDAIQRQAVETGASSIAKFQVTTGLRDGDAVALPTDLPLQPGQKVHPIFP
jgi:HlyD family secretion protein